MASKGCKCAECEECPEWIFTFADLVMLMMGFFVILWVLKPNPTKKNASGGENGPDAMVKIAANIRDGFGYVPDPHSSDPVDRFMISQALTRIRPPGKGTSGHTENDPNGPKGSDPEVTSIRPSKHATEGGKFLFESGSADLTDSTRQDLNEIADLFRGHRNIIMIKGHTALDDLPDGATAAQKMDLSLRRAQAAANYLSNKGIDPSIIRVQGCSTFEPLVTRQYDESAQDQNRRVEVEATNALAPDADGATSAPASRSSEAPAPAPTDSSTQGK